MCSIGDDNLDINVEKYMPNKQKLNLHEKHINNYKIF